MPLEKQLYTFLRDLRLYIEDENQLGSIIGYSILDRILTFSTKTGSLEEKKFQQVKSLYQKLEGYYERCSKNKNSDIGFEILCELQSSLTPFLQYSALEINLQEYETEQKNSLSNKKIRTKNEEKPPLKYLLSSYLISRNTRNYEDILRRIGLNLRDQIVKRGPVSQTRNIFNSDYDALENIFRKK